MQKILLLLLFFSCLNIVSAQEVSVTPNPSFYEAEGIDIENWNELNNDAFMKNEGIEETQYAWIKTIESAPEEWEFGVVDINLSYIPTIDTTPLPLTFPAGEDGILRVNLYPNGVAGCGIVRMDIALWSDIGIHEIIYSAYYEFKVNTPGECLSSVNETIFEKINISPNPTSDFFTIKTLSDYSNIQLFNTAGQFVKSFSKAEKYSVYDLPKALYFVQIFNQNERIGTQKIIIGE